MKDLPICLGGSEYKVDLIPSGDGMCKPNAIEHQDFEQNSSGT